jgi:hypothetical protein
MYEEFDTPTSDTLDLAAYCDDLPETPTLEDPLPESFYGAEAIGDVAANAESLTQLSPTAPQEDIADDWSGSEVNFNSDELSKIGGSAPEAAQTPFSNFSDGNVSASMGTPQSLPPTIGAIPPGYNAGMI